MRIIIVFSLLLLYINPTKAQKIETAFGNISVLAGEKELSVSFGYEDVNVHGYTTELEFLKDKMQIRENRNLGSGEAFKDSWFADRDSIYAPMFIDKFNYVIPKKRKVSISRNNPKAKYNFHIQTLWIYPGYSIGFYQAAKIEVAIKLYEVLNPENVIWESTSPIRIEADSTPTEKGMRIGVAYRALAKSMSWLMKKKAK